MFKVKPRITYLFIAPNIYFVKRICIMAPNDFSNINDKTLWHPAAYRFESLTTRKAQYTPEALELLAELKEPLKARGSNAKEKNNALPKAIIIEGIRYVNTV